jgi:N5-(cytidine 5'-diphosphoramidyl)-L-glutamine hydrolase
MRILISQQEYDHPPFFFTFDCLERSWYNLLAGHTLIPVPNIPTWDFSKIEYDCLLLTGGNDSISRHLTEDRLYKISKETNKIIIGVCHGAFAINDIEGGVNGKIDNHRGTNHKIYMEDAEHYVNSYHGQSITKLPDDFISLAVDDQNNIEAFRHETLDIYGMVWHPERMKNPVLPSDLREKIC